MRVSAPASGDGSSPDVVELRTDGLVALEGDERLVVVEWLGGPRARLRTPDGTHVLVVLPVEQVSGASGVSRYEVFVDGWRFELDVEPERRARLRERATRAGAGRRAGGPLELRAMIPGRVVTVDVAEGDVVEAGTRLMVIEAMKMQNELRAPRAGTASRIAVAAGRNIELGDLLVVLE